MARAIAKCECGKCGKEFEKIKRDCKNRSDADSWEGWASNYYTLCDDCSREQYRQVQEEKAKNNGLKVIRVKYSEYKSKYNDCAQVKDSYDKETKTIEIYVKEDLYEERIEKQQKEEELKAIQTKMVVDYNLYKNYFSSIPSVRDSYSSKYREITLLVTPTQRQEIEEKIKYLEDLEAQRQDIEVDYEIYKRCLKNEFNYKSYSQKYGTVTLHLLPHNIEKAKQMIKEYEDKYIETIVLYKDYKKLYSEKGYRTKDYNSKKGTIVVYLPKEITYERKEKDKHYEDKFAFKNGFLDELIITPNIINPDDVEVEVPECLMN